MKSVGESARSPWPVQCLRRGVDDFQANSELMLGQSENVYDHKFCDNGKGKSWPRNEIVDTSRTYWSFDTFNISPCNLSNARFPSPYTIGICTSKIPINE